ncbi:phosphotransferase [Candidatus Vidania fulgoroideorum]
MAFYTKIKKKLIKKKLIKYKIKHAKIKGIKKGTTNSNYLLKNKKKKYILTIIEEKTSFSNIMYVIFLQNSLYYNKNKVPLFIKDIFNERIIIIKKKKTLITSFLLGKSKKKINKKHCFYLGLAIKKIHKNKFYFKKKNKISTKFLFLLFKKIKKNIPKKYFFFIRLELLKNIKFEKKNYKKNFKYTNCHCDIFPDNVFFNKNKVSGIFDFYYSSLENYLFDLSIIFCEWCFLDKMNFLNFKYFLFSYFFSKKKVKIKYILFFVRKISLRFMLTRFKNIKNVFCKNKTPYRYIKILVFINKNFKNIINILFKLRNNCNEKFYNIKNFK